MLRNLRYAEFLITVLAASSMLLGGLDEATARMALFSEAGTADTQAPRVAGPAHLRLAGPVSAPLGDQGAVQPPTPGGPAGPYAPAIAKAQPSLNVVRQHQSLLKSGDAQRADDTALAWLVKHPDDRIVRTYLARSYLKRQRERDAIEQYEALLSRIPNEQEALNTLAVLYQRAGDPRALTMAQKVYSLKPDSAAYADTLGWILVQKGETAKGLKLLEQAVAGAPADPEIRLHLAQALAKAGQGAKAREALGALKGMKLTPEQESQRQKLLDQGP